MESKNIFYELRTRCGYSQDDLAGKVFVTRQAVSRWENGETVPNTETLKLLSQLYNVSINTLLGAPRQTFCQCCGMPLEIGYLSREADGKLNENYCRWCYADGRFAYADMDDLIEVCVPNMVGQGFSEEQARTYLKEKLPQLDYWKKAKDQEENAEALKKQLLEEINALRPEGMPEAATLYALAGRDVNLAYPLPGGETARFLDDGRTYFGNQLPGEDGRCFGVLADESFLLICSYGPDGADPELLVYKKR